MKELDNIIEYICNQKLVNNIKDVDKARYILNYLEKLWSFKNIDEKIKDIMLLINKISYTSFKDFINELYLNQSLETNLDNTLYLTTIHGSKGLEWENVYIIDMDSEHFPNIKYGFFKDECDEMEEERRLFYVACSRAKTNLSITYNYCFNPSSFVLMSPFVREIERTLYNNINVDYKSYNMTGNIYTDVNNYLKYFGYAKLYPLYQTLKYERINLHNMIEIPKYIDKIRYSKIIVSNFFDFLIAKIIQINFNKKIKKFELNIIHKLEKMPQKIRQNYIDELNDWRNLLNDIFFMATFNIKDDSNIFDDIKRILINETIYANYDMINIKLSSYINTMKPKEIVSHYNVSHAQIKGDINILVDNNIIDIKTSSNEVVSMSNLTQTFLYGYLISKKNKQLKNIILYNPLQGDMTVFNMMDFDFKQLANIVYGHFKTN